MGLLVRKSLHSPLPFYAVALLWLSWSVLLPLYKIWHFALVGALSVGVFWVAGILGKDFEPGEPAGAGSEKPAAKASGNPDIDKLIADGEKAVQEMRRLNNSIPDERLSAQIDDLEETTNKIIDHVVANPKKLPQIRRFMNYYLPTSIKLLNTYDRMGAQGVSGENIDQTMDKVENTMDVIVAAFHKQLDSLFGAEALDISTDISVLETMMAREGLTQTAAGDFGAAPEASPKGASPFDVDFAAAEEHSFESDFKIEETEATKD